MDKKSKNKVVGLVVVNSILAADVLGTSDAVISYANDIKELSGDLANESILGVPAYKNNKVSFPNANYNEDICGFSIKTGVATKYTHNNENKIAPTGIIESNKKMTKEEFSDLLKSLELDLNESDAKVEVSVGKEISDFVYFESTGNYYKFIDKEILSLEDTVESAKSQSVYGKAGSIAVINSDEEKEFLMNISGGKLGLVKDASSNIIALNSEMDKVEDFSILDGYFVEIEKEESFMKVIENKTIKAPVQDSVQLPATNNGNEGQSGASNEDGVNSDNSIISDDNNAEIEKSQIIETIDITNGLENAIVTSTGDVINGFKVELSETSPDNETVIKYIIDGEEKVHANERIIEFSDSYAPEQVQEIIRTIEISSYEDVQVTITLIENNVSSSLLVNKIPRPTIDSIDISEGLDKAVIVSSKDILSGLNISVKSDDDVTNRVVYRYAVDGEAKMVKGNTLDITGEYTPEELQNILRSVHINSGENITVTVTIPDLNVSDEVMLAGLEIPDVEPIEINSVDISNGLENAIVTSSRDYIDGFKIEVKHPDTTNRVVYRYTLNGQEVINRNQTLNFYDRYTPQQVQEILRSMTVETGKEVEVTVTLGNLSSTYQYCDIDGHYYRYVTSNYTWDKADEYAVGTSYNGEQGYLATINTKSLRDALKRNYNLHIGLKRVGGEYVWNTDEDVTFLDVAYSGDYMYMGSDGKFYGVNKLSSTASSRTAYFLIEYGTPNERMARPTVNVSSTLSIPGKEYAPDDEPIEVNSIDISNGLENAVVTSSRDFIQGFKVEVKHPDTTNRVVYRYTMNGQEVVNRNQTLNFYDRYTPQEIQDVLRSMTIETGKEVEITVTLGNMLSDVYYSNVDGHYYRYRNSTYLWTDADTRAKTYSLYGETGYLATIDSAELRDDLRRTNNYHIGLKSVSGGNAYSNGEEALFQDIASSGSYYYMSGTDGRFYGVQNISSTATNQRAYYLVEFGKPGERMARPTINTSSTLTVTGREYAPDNEPIEVNSIDISNGLENAVVTSSRDFIQGFKVEVKHPDTTNRVVYRYTMNGQEVVNRNQTLNFYDRYTPQEVQDMLRSMTIETGKEVEITVTLGNMLSDVYYSNVDGHYYRYRNSTYLWTDADTRAKTYSLYGEAGYLATIDSAELRDDLRRTNNYHIGLKSVSGGYAYSNGEEATFQDIASSGSYYYMSGSDGRFYGVQNISSTATNQRAYYLVEFGKQGERMARPTVVKSSSVSIPGRELSQDTEPIEINSIDISNGLENAVVTSSRDFIQGFKVEVKHPDTTNRVVYRYTMNGQEVVNRNQTLNFYDRYTPQEVQDMLRSMTIETGKEVEITVTLGNMISDVYYSNVDGHYYRYRNSSYLWEDADTRAKTYTLYGETGYLATIDSSELRDDLKRTNNYHIGLKSVSGGNAYSNGEEATFQDIASSGSYYYYMSGADGRFYGVNNLSSTASSRKAYYLVEFGKPGERMARPTVVKSSSVSVSAKEYAPDNEPIEINSVDISNGFENAVVTSSRGFIQGFKVEVKHPDTTNRVVYRYTMDGKEVVNRNQTLNFYDRYTPQEVQDMLRSMTIETGKEVEITVTLGNMLSDVYYSNVDGHYYRYRNSTYLWEDADTRAKTYTLYGEAGYLATIDSAELRDDLRRTNNYHIGLKSVSGGNAYSNGEEATFQDIASSGSYYYMSGTDGRFYGVNNLSSTASSRKAYYLVEFGTPNERMARPTVTKSSSVSVSAKEYAPDNEPIEINSVDISNGFENAVVTSSRGFIQGFKVEVSESTPIDNIIYTYTLNGKEVTSRSKILNFYDTYTPQEVEDILKTIKIEAESVVDIKVTLGNMLSDVYYSNVDGHYYRYRNSSYLWEDADTRAKTYTLYGETGYLATIDSSELRDDLKRTNNYHIGLKSVSGGNAYSNGEEATFQDIASSGSYYYMSGADGRFYGVNNLSSTASSRKAYYLVEFGKPGERMLRPTVNTSSVLTVTGVEFPEDNEPLEVNSIDISNGLENAVVTSSRDFILGFKVEVNNPTPWNKVVYRYTLNGEEVINRNQTLNFYESYTPEEVQEILRSMTISSRDDVEVVVTLGNIKPTVVYIPEEGHYYEHVNSNKTWANANNHASENTLYGTQGYLASLNTKEIRDELISDNNYHIGLIKGSDGNYVWNTNERAVFLDVAYNGNYMYMGTDGKFYGVNKLSSTESNQLAYSIVEYGAVGERMPRPTVNVSSSVIVDGIDLIIEDAEPIEVNSVDISNGLENAVVTSSRDFILGFKVEVSQPTPSNKVVYEYTLNGNKVTNRNQTLNFYGRYTPEEIEEILKSMTVISTRDVDVTVTLGNMPVGMKYVQQDGHYYQYSTTKHNWNDSNDNATNSEYLGNQGYLATIDTSEIRDILKSDEAYHVGLISDSLGGHVWKNGEDVLFADIVDETALSYTMLEDGLFYNSNKYSDSKYLTEYGVIGERMPRPTVNTSSSCGVKAIEIEVIEDTEPIEVNSVDISNGLENAVVTSTRDFILGFKVHLVNPSGANQIKYKYTLNGEEVENKNRELNFYDKYTPQEVQDILRSMTVETGEKLELVVTLGNLKSNVKYLESEGHYYEYSTGTTRWDSANNNASKNSLFGEQGYLAVIDNDEIRNELDIKKKYHIGLIGSGDGGHIWVNGDNVFNAEIVDPEASKLTIFEDGKYYDSNTNPNSFYITEYGKTGERMPRPTVQATSSVEVSVVYPEDTEPVEINSVDLSKGFKNAVVTSNRDFILGFKVEIITPGSSATVKTTYTLNDKEVSDYNRTLNFYDKYTVQEVQDVIRSMRFTSSSLDSATVKITLGNMDPNIKYIEDEGHYYEYSTKSMTASSSNSYAAGRRLYGEKGYLATVNTKELMDALKHSKNNYITGFGVDYKSGKNIYSWRSGEPDLFRRISGIDRVSETYSLNTSGSLQYIYSYESDRVLVEFGQPGQRMPRPTANVSDEIDVVLNDEIAPVISATDKIYEINIDIDRDVLLDGVSVTDNRDGVISNDEVTIEIKDVTDKDITNENGSINWDIEAEIIDKIDSSTESEYIITYTVEDRAYNQSKKSILCIVEDSNIVIKDIHLEGYKDNNIFHGEFNISDAKDLTDSRKYKVFRKGLDTDYAEVKELQNPNLNNVDDILDKLKFEDEIAEDKLSPIIDTYYLIRNEDGSVKVEIKADDLVDNYTYQVKGYDRKNRLVEISNEVSKVGHVSGVAGYNYVLDNNPVTQISGSNSMFLKDNVLNIDSTENNRYLHVNVIDNAGNISETIHVDLEDKSHNNKPIINLIPNRVIGAGSKFDPMDGVNGFDYEEGDISGNITINGLDKIDTSKPGSYEIEYEIKDSNGVITTEKVTIHVTGSMNLTVTGGFNKSTLEWDKINGALSYEVYRADLNSESYNLIGEYKDNTFVDNTSLDKDAPIITGVNEKYEPTEYTEDEESLVHNTKITINAKDTSSEYKYYVVALDSSGKTLNSSNIASTEIKSGLNGYSFIVDDKDNTDAPTEMMTSEIDDISNAIKNNKGKYLHIRVFDKNLNYSITYHYLIGSNCDTNYIPNIEGAKNLVTTVGKELDLRKDVIAYDYEDKDLTHAIKIEENIDYSKPGVYDVAYSVEDSNGNVKKEQIKVRVVKYMNLTVTPDIENNNIVLDWTNSSIDEQNVYYEVKKYDSTVDRYIKIAQTKDTVYVDEDAKDLFGSTYINSEKIINDDGTMTFIISSSDAGITCKYQVVAKLEDSKEIIGSMTDIYTKEEAFGEATLVGGVDSYDWKLSNEREDSAEDGFNTKGNSISFDPESYEWLHLCPVDLYGNRGDIVHIKLKGSSSSNTIPVIEGSDITILVDEEVDLSKLVTVKDAEDGDLTEFVKYEGSVNTSLVGTYPVKYIITDFDGGTSTKVINVNVVDNIYTGSLEETKDSFITVSNKEEVYVHVGSDYDVKEGLKVISSVDGDITDSITYKTDLDLTKLGSYIVYYKGTDSTGKNISFNRVVHVVDEDEVIDSNQGNITGNAPVIYKPGYVTEDGEIVEDKYTHLSIKLGEEVDLKGFFNAYDIEDKDISDKIEILGTVDFSKVGWHTVTYKVTDSDMNSSYKTLNIEIHDRVIEDENGGAGNDNNNGNNSGNNNGNNDGSNNGNNNGSNSGSNNGSSNSGIYEDLDINIDIDKDGKPDLNIDINGDGRPDINIDIDKDGKADINIDTNGDNKPDINVDTDGDGEPDTNADTDGDGKVDTDVSDKPQTGDTITNHIFMYCLSSIGLLLNNKKRKKK